MAQEKTDRQPLTHLLLSSSSRLVAEKREHTYWRVPYRDERLRVA